MTDNQKKLVFEYCGWEQKYEGNFFPIGTLHVFHSLDGNDMVEAVKIMESKKDWRAFYYETKANYMADVSHGFFDEYFFVQWLFGSPENFFSLMGEWLEVRK